MRLSPFHARWILAIMVILLAGLVAWIYWALGEIEHAGPKLRKTPPGGVEKVERGVPVDGRK